MDTNQGVESWGVWTDEGTAPCGCGPNPPGLVFIYTMNAFFVRGQLVEVGECRVCRATWDANQIPVDT